MDSGTQISLSVDLKEEQGRVEAAARRRVVSFLELDPWQHSCSAPIIMSNQCLWCAITRYTPKSPYGQAMEMTPMMLLDEKSPNSGHSPGTWSELRSTFLISKKSAEQPFLEEDKA